MTFTEAAIEVLRREGKPLHYRKIAEIGIRDSLLDHVGKIPEEVMGSQLAAHCRLPHADRRLVVVQPGTFALAEWGLEEDPAGLENLIELPPEDEVPYRPRERHPVPSREMTRGLSRDGARARRREGGEERRGRRFPPPAEVAYEILAGAERPLGLTEIAAMGAERLLMPDAFVRDTASLAAALREDNRRREAAGRRALFSVEGETVTLAAQPEPGERPAAPPAAPRLPAGPAEMRRAALAALRRRLRACDAPTLEHLAARLLERTGMRDLKVAKRGREQVVYTCRKKMGLGDVRHCVRILRTGADAGRREVAEVRRDLGNYGAQVGVLLTPGEAARDARAEAAAAGQLPVLLLCGEALAESFAEAGLVCSLVVVPEIDEAAFQAAAEAADREEAARRARREERDRRRAAAPAPAPEGAPPSAGGAAAPEAQGETAAAAPAPEAGEPAASREQPGADAEEGAAEEVEEDAGPGAAKEVAGEGRRRRRRRRRGGRGRGERPPGLASGAPAGAAQGSPAPAPAVPAETSPSMAPPPAAAPGGAEGAS